MARDPRPWHTEEVNVQIESLRYFIALAQAGSFYGAAKNLLISQQGLNKAITSLEAELGIQLVERSRRGVRLTSDGEVFLKHAERIVEDHRSMVDELLDGRFEGPEGEEPITLYVSYYGAQTAVSNTAYIGLLAENSAYLEEPFDKLVQRAVLSDGSDLCYVDINARSLPSILQNPDVQFEPIVKTKFGFVCREDSPLAQEPALHRIDLAKLPIALNAHREMTQLAEWLFRDHPLENVRMGVTNPRMLLEFVHASEYESVAAFDSFGFFVSQLDDNMPTDGLKFVPLSTPGAVCQVGFLYPRHKKLSLHAQHCVDVLKRFLAENCGAYFEKYDF